MAAIEESHRLPSLPVARAGMLVRKPVAEVFNAFVDPAITSRFWFTQGSGKLAPGARVRWDWEMYGVSSYATVQALEENRRIVIEWAGDESSTTVEWRFLPHGDEATYVSITNAGFVGDGDAVVAQAIGATEGFSLVLAGLKAWLEHGVRLNLVADKFPDGLAGV